MGLGPLSLPLPPLPLTSAASHWAVLTAASLCASRALIPATSPSSRRAASSELEARRWEAAAASRSMLSAAWQSSLRRCRSWSQPSRDCGAEGWKEEGQNMRRPWRWGSRVVTQRERKEPPPPSAHSPAPGKAESSWPIFGSCSSCLIIRATRCPWL